MESVNIGVKIKAVVTKKGMTVSEFGRRITKSRENVYSIFKRKSIDTALLLKISKVLEYDFFSYYSDISKEYAKVVEENKLLKEMIAFKKKKTK